MCEGNFEDSSYRGSRPIHFPNGAGDEVSYFRHLDFSQGEDSPLGLMAFGLDRELPAWVEADFGKPVLDLGPGRKIIPGAVRIDWPEYDFEPVRQLRMIKDQTGAEFDARVPGLNPRGRLLYGDGTVGGVFAINIMEHLWDPRPLIWEVCRVLAPGAPFTVFVPDGRSPLYAQDLDHKKPFVLDSFRSLLQNPYYSKDHPSNNIKLGWASKFAIKEGNETLLFQIIKGK